MLRIGTVFSGIGAIEHALKRMNINTSIEFACDTGDVDIFSRKMKVTIEDTEIAFQEFNELMNHKLIENLEDKEFFEQLKIEINLLKEKFNELKNEDMSKTIEDLEKYFLSEKLIKCVMNENFYLKPITDKPIASTLLKSMHKMHRAGVDNYVHTEGRLRKLTPRECLRLMGFCDSFEIVVANTPAYMQAGNSIVVDVLIHIMKQILKSYDLTKN